MAWRKMEGDKISTGDVLYEIETDKSTMVVEVSNYHSPKNARG